MNEFAVSLGRNNISRHSQFDWLQSTVRAVVLAFLVLCAGCGDDKPSKPPTRNYDEVVESGWAYFRSANFNSALAEFKSALLMDVTRYEAFSGTGWSYAMIDSLYLGRYAFLECLQRNPMLVDPLVGLSAIYRDLPDLEQALESGHQALLADPDFEFVHQPSFDWRDVRLILAECHFALGQYELAYDEVLAIDPEADLDPGSGTFRIDLLHSIEALVSQYGGI